ncbi:MAG: hypothetical protein RDV41_10530 [Planctomycetota bacterium]|nr:hypothetical protein [Planctomycetota bacterium]
MQRFLGTVLVTIALVSLLRLWADEGETPAGVTERVRLLREQAEKADRDGDVRLAEELRAQAGRLEQEQSQRRAESAKRAVVERAFSQDDFRFFQTGRTLREMVDITMNYLQNVNLLNGLNLTEDQIKRLLDILKKKRDACHARDWEEILKGYLVVKDGLEADNAGADLFDIFMQTEGRFLKLVDKRPDERTSRALSQELEKLLTDAQKEVIRTYVPCHYPPDDLRNPIRVGQSEESTPDLIVLVNGRNMPAGREFEEWYRRSVTPAVERKIARFMERGDFKTEADAQGERARIRKIFDDARAMSDVDFKLNQAKLAAQLQFDPDYGPVPQDVSEKVAAHLLDERFIPLLEKRLARLADGSGPGEGDKTDLDTVPPTDRPT